MAKIDLLHFVSHSPRFHTLLRVLSFYSPLSILLLWFLLLFGSFHHQQLKNLIFHFVTSQLTCFFLSHIIWIRITENANWLICPDVEVHVISAGKLRHHIWGGHPASTEFQREICTVDWIPEKWLYECAKAMRHHEGWTKYRQQRLRHWHTTWITPKVCNLC